MFLMRLPCPVTEIYVQWYSDAPVLKGKNKREVRHCPASRYIEVETIYFFVFTPLYTTYPRASTTRAAMA